jgi:hypothetical protein
MSEPVPATSLEGELDEVKSGFSFDVDGNSNDYAKIRAKKEAYDQRRRAEAKVAGDLQVIRDLGTIVIFVIFLGLGKFPEFRSLCKSI